jgi:hypothetical protein
MGRPREREREGRRGLRFIGKEEDLVPIMAF